MNIVAEIGMNYNGNLDLAYELIRKAKESGATIAKFQFGWRDKPGEINFLNKERATCLKEWCDYWDIEMMASLITEEALELARSIGMNRYKIAARTVIDRPGLVKQVLAEGKETFVSLGMYVGEKWPFGPPSEKLRYIYCRSKYPSYPEDLTDFPSRFSPETFYGYSDHLHGMEGCLLAVARGARYVEKHFTLNRADATIRDHVLSATPDEFQLLPRLGIPLAKLISKGGEKK